MYRSSTSTVTFYQFIRPKPLAVCTEREVLNGVADPVGVVRSMAFDLGVPFGDLLINDLCPICKGSTHLYLIQIRDKLTLWNGNEDERP